MRRRPEGVERGHNEDELYNKRIETRRDDSGGAPDVRINHVPRGNKEKVSSPRTSSVLNI